jgi:hypothetical protein
MIMMMTASIPSRMSPGRRVAAVAALFLYLWIGCAITNTNRYYNVVTAYYIPGENPYSYIEGEMYVYTDL